MRWWPLSILPPEVLAAYWMLARRVFAFFIDWLVVALPLTALAALLFVQEVDVGPEGRWFGIAALIAYLTIANSNVTGGRSLGMRAAGIQVVDAQSRPISIALSLARAVILLAPLVLAPELGLLGQLFTSVIYALLVAGLGAAQVYLLWANARSGRLLHDLLVGTFVVRRATAPASDVRLWFGHWLAVAGFVGLSLVLPFLPMSWFDTTEPGRSLTFPVKLQRALAADDSLAIRSYSAQSSTTYSGSRVTSHSRLHIGVRVYRKDADLNAAIKNVATRVLELAPDAMGYGMLSIEAASGVDLGIASWSRSFLCFGTAQQWRDANGECPSHPE